VILILANKWDLTVDLVVLELQRRHAEFMRLNTEDLPSWSAVARFPSGDVRLDQGSRGLIATDITAVWNRRPGHVFDDLPLSERPSAAVQRFVTDQWFAWLEALQQRTDVLWVNPPASNAAMESKVRQLALAHDIGFSIPDTLISNDVAIVREWLRDLGGPAICKALYSPLIEDADQDHFIFTTLLEDIPADAADSLRVAPVIFQRALLPKIDYRVTVIGNRVFAVRVGVDNDVLDWRTATTEVAFDLCRLPSVVEQRCRDFLCAAGLHFGAIDLVEASGEFYFLEVNPNGEWGWLQRPHGVPIAPALSSVLMREVTA
jgi:glutathione synthase/RimK-type ligase-like ATP-grasp enzyme